MTAVASWWLLFPWLPVGLTNHKRDRARAVTQHEAFGGEVALLLAITPARTRKSVRRPGIGFSNRLLRLSLCVPRLPFLFQNCHIRPGTSEGTLFRPVRGPNCILQGAHWYYDCRLLMCLGLSLETSGAGGTWERCRRLKVCPESYVCCEVAGGNSWKDHQSFSFGMDRAFW